MDERKKKEFQRIMGLGSMPPDTGPDYDEWLFTKSWQAALASREAEMGEMHWIPASERLPASRTWVIGCI